METVFWLFVILFSIVIHEVSHGLAAYRLGDTTAKDAGRLTLNPLKHIDLFWTILLPAALYFSTHGKLALGMAKPVPVNFRRLRNPKTGTILVSLAGPAANLAAAYLLGRFWQATGHETALYAAYLNVGLAVFNLFPIPPLDGSRVLLTFLPDSFYPVYAFLEKFGFIIIVLLYSTRILFYWLIPGMQVFCRVLNLPLPTLGLLQ